MTRHLLHIVLSMTLLVGSTGLFCSCSDDTKEKLESLLPALDGTRWVMMDTGEMIYLNFLGNGSGEYAMQLSTKSESGTMTYSYTNSQIIMNTDKGEIYVWTIVEYVAGRSMTLTDSTGTQWVFQLYGSNDDPNGNTSQENSLIVGYWVHATDVNNCTIFYFKKDRSGLQGFKVNGEDTSYPFTYVYDQQTQTVNLKRSDGMRLAYTVVSLTEKQLVLRDGEGVELSFTRYEETASRGLDTIVTQETR